MPRRLCNAQLATALPSTSITAAFSARCIGSVLRYDSRHQFDIKEVLVAGDRVIVRGEVTGTPAGDLFGVPHTGKSFRMMAIDIQPSEDKISRTFHMENWLSAIGQLREVIEVRVPHAMQHHSRRECVAFLDGRVAALW